MGLFGNRKDKAKREEEQWKRSIDYSSIFSTIENGQLLFNQLKIRCHPDRYAGTDKQALAEELFKQVQANSTNYAKLLLLEERIDNEL